MIFCIMLLSFTQNDEPMAAIVKKTNCILKPYMIFLNIVRKKLYLLHIIQLNCFDYKFIIVAFNDINMFVIN